MPWSTALSVGGSLLGGVMGGGSRKAERSARDAAARAQFAQDSARRQSVQALNPYMETGENANRLLSQFLGTADPEGFARRPTLQQFEDQLRNEHFQKFGTDYTRGSNLAGQQVEAQRRYDQAIKDWEAGRARFIQENPGSQGDGRLLRDFTNADFVKDPGYEFRMAEGEKGINRALAARGGFDSGSALKALNRFNQDFASNEFGNAYNRDALNKQRIFNFLSGEKQDGLAAAGTLSGVALNTANNSGRIGLETANTVNNLQQTRNMTQANALQGAIGNLIYGMNRPRDSGVVSTPTWSTPPINGVNSSAGNRNWWSNNIG